MEMIKRITTSPAVPANLLTSIRAVCNLFKNSYYHEWLQKHRSEVSTVHLYLSLGMFGKLVMNTYELFN